jgi:hypothetical protein
MAAKQATAKVATAKVTATSDATERAIETVKEVKEYRTQPIHIPQSC